MAGKGEVPRSCTVTAPGDLCVLSEGLRCLLYVTGRHFLVHVLAMDDDTVRVSFPGKDYPIEGMHADMEFHDETGYCYYSTEVVRGPMEGEEGIVLRRPSEIKRNIHRSSCRIPTDLTVQVKDRDHVRRYNASLLNLSGGGALVQTEAPFDFSTVVELDLSLPGESTHVITCQVAQIMPSGHAAGDSSRQLSLRFSSVAEEATLSITHFIWRRLQETYGQP